MHLNGLFEQPCEKGSSKFSLVGQWLLDPFSRVFVFNIRRRSWIGNF